RGHDAVDPPSGEPARDCPKGDADDQPRREHDEREGERRLCAVHDRHPEVAALAVRAEREAERSRIERRRDGPGAELDERMPLQRVHRREEGRAEAEDQPGEDERHADDQLPVERAPHVVVPVARWAKWPASASRSKRTTAMVTASEPRSVPVVAASNRRIACRSAKPRPGQLKKPSTTGRVGSAIERPVATAPMIGTAALPSAWRARITDSTRPFARAVRM